MATNRNGSSVRGRVVGAVALASLGTLTACLGGGGSSDSESEQSGGGAIMMGPDTVIPLVSEARVDLPGKVSIFVQVLNSDGSPAADLAPNAFRIFENDQSVSESESQQQLRPRPQVFRSFTHLILDRSNSVQQSQAAIDAQKEGAQRYVDVVVADSPENFVKVSWFDGQDELHAIAGHDLGFTNDLLALRAAIDALDDEPPFSPSTNLYGAVIDALDDLDEADAEAAAAGIENRSLALVTFTDGTHQAGPVATLEEAASRVAQQVDGRDLYSAFTIGLGSEIDGPVLRDLGPDGAEFANEIEDLVPRFEAVGAGVRDLANSFYLLSYCSPKTIGSHELRVSVSPNPTSGDVTFPFEASFFGAGCGFLDVFPHPELAAGSPRTFVADAIEDEAGRVLVCGWRTSDCTASGCGEIASAFVARFLADPVEPDPELRLDGRLDPSFGSGGVRLLAQPSLAVSGATGLAWDPLDGALLVGGWSRTNPGVGVAQASAWRVTNDGANVLQVDMPNPEILDQVVNDIAVDLQGRLILVGSRGAAVRSTAVWAVDSVTFTPDSSFGSFGLFLHPEAPTSPEDVGRTVAVAPDGHIVVVGDGFSPNAPIWNDNREAKLLYLDPIDGKTDSTFAGDGVAFGSELFPGVPLPIAPEAVAIDAEGRVVFAGAILESQGAGSIREQPVLCRILNSGTADTTFAGSVASRFPATGVVTLRLGSTGQPDIDFGRDAGITDLHLDLDGGVLATGWRDNAEGHTDLAMFGFQANGIPASDYNVVGFLIEDGSVADNSFETGSAMLVHSTGSIWTLGSSRPPGSNPEVTTIWIDRDPARAFPPLGN